MEKRIFKLLAIFVVLTLLVAVKQEVKAIDNEYPRQSLSQPKFPLADIEQVRLRSPGVDKPVYGGRPTFKWYQDIDATSYIIELYNPADTLIGSWQKNPVCDPYCQYRIPREMDFGSSYGNYDWRVRTVIDGEEGPWSEMRMFTYTELERTWQISPERYHNTVDLTPTLEWADITGATMYLMQIRLESNPEVLKILVPDATYCDGTTCTWEVPDELAPMTIYKWHVRAKNGRNFGRWTAYREIIINNELITEAPVQLYPVTESGFVSLGGFSWESMDLISMYTVEVQDADTHEVVFEQDKFCVQSTCWLYKEEVSGGLNFPLGRYDWYVYAKNGLGDGPRGDGSRFYMTLDEVTKLEPWDRISMVSEPTFQWEPMAEADAYQIEVKYRESNERIWVEDVTSDAACDAEVCSFTAAEPLPLGELKWHVRAIRDNVGGAWADYFILYKSDTVAVPWQEFPRGGIVYEGSPSFQWESIFEADSYTIELVGPDGQNTYEMEVDSSVCSSSLLCEYTSPLELGSDYGGYAWRIKANVGDQSSEWSDTESYQYWQVEYVKPNLPQNGLKFNDHTPVFKWWKGNTATHYEFELYDEELTLLEQTTFDRSICPGFCVYNYTSGLSEGEYWWRVRGKNGSNFSDWAPLQVFTIDNEATTDSTYFSFHHETDLWIDAYDVWSISDNETYSSEYSTTSPLCVSPAGCQGTHYDVEFTDALLVTSIRSNASADYQGYSVFFRTDIGTYLTGGNSYYADIYDSYPIYFYQVGSDLCTEFQSYSPTAYYTPICIENKNINDYHEIAIYMVGDRFDFYLDGVPVAYLDGLTRTEGFFMFDVISAASQNHTVDVDWVEIIDLSTAGAMPEFVSINNKGNGVNLAELLIKVDEKMIPGIQQ